MLLLLLLIFYPTTCFISISFVYRDGISLFYAAAVAILDNAYITDVLETLFSTPLSRVHTSWQNESNLLGCCFNWVSIPSDPCSHARNLICLSGHQKSFLCSQEYKPDSSWLGLPNCSLSTTFMFPSSLRNHVLHFCNAEQHLLPCRWNNASLSSSLCY